MTDTINISGLQMLVTHDVAQNEGRILGAIELAANDGSDFLLTPEGSLSGYHADFDRIEVADSVERVVAAARNARVGLALGTCYKEIEDGDEYCYNQVRLYSPEGTYLGFHAKILRCSSLGHPGTGEMTDYVEGTLRIFDWRGCRFGALICNDMWATPGCTVMPNPYLAWRLKQMGAQVILHAIHSGHDQHFRPYHEANVALWASTLAVHIVEVNAINETDQPTNAAGGVVGPDGNRIVAAPDIGEQYFACAIPY